MSETPVPQPASKRAPNTKGEHIFPATIIEPMALRWKALTQAEQHDEANQLLEEIIRLSTPMLARFAQHERYNMTVELPMLVSMAQSRIEVWLRYWDPSKGRIFSWFTKSLAGNSLVLLADGTTKRIDEIVENRLQVDVVSWDETARQFVSKPITHWTKSPVTRPPKRRKVDPKSNPDDMWRRLSVKHLASQRGQALLLTGDHEVYTQRGWVEVDYLVPGDCLYQRDTLLTSYGKSALIGIYLGDGTIRTVGQSTILSGTHGEKQLDYSRFIQDKLKRLCPEGEQQYMHKGVSRPYKVAAFGLSFRRSWPDYDVGWMPCKKSVTSWLIESLTPVSLAYWYMDDGHLKWYPKTGTVYGVSLSTESFSEADCQTLIEALWTKFGIKSSFAKRSWADYGSIVIKAEQAVKFLDLAAQHIPPVMRVKLPRSHWDIPFVDQDFVLEVVTPCSWELSPAYRCDETRSTQTNPVSLEWKYDITVADTQNFVANGVVVHNCSKHVFLGEVAKATVHRQRYHATSDSLEQIAGAEDPQIEADADIEFVQKALAEIECRWSNPQVLDCIRFHIASIVENPRGPKKPVIRAGSFASGLSIELSRFAHNWALYAIRSAMYDRLKPQYTDIDLLTYSESFTLLPDLLDIITVAQLKKIIATMGGQRLRIPTVVQVEKLVRSQKIAAALAAHGSLNPTTVASVARDHGVSERTAEEVFETMTGILDPERNTQRAVYS